ncbi:MAG: 2-hydroxyacyl-CoA dehydratase subunit D [Promethearchaeota archaeon]
MASENISDQNNKQNNNQNQSAPKKKLVKTLKTSRKLKRLILWYLLKGELYSRLPWKKTAWSTSAFPIEFLWMYDIYPYLPENCATISAARHISQELIEEAEALGYSQNLCSYMKTNIGAWNRKNLSATLGGIRKPDFMCTTNTICDTHFKWFEIMSRKLKVPLYIIDVPSYVSGSDDQRMERYIDYVIEQFYEFTDFVYDVTGKKFSKKKFFKALDKADRLAELWMLIYEYRKNIPSPIGYADTLGDILPMFALPGEKSDRGIKFYRELLNDVKEAVKLKKGVVADEKHRLVFEGIPFWYKIKFFHQLALYGSVVTYEPYTYSFGARRQRTENLEESLRKLVKPIIHSPYFYNLETRLKYFGQIIDEYTIDGVILHNNLSCRPSATGLLDLKEYIQNVKNIPAIILTCDMNDPRAFSEAQMQNRLESFIEVLDSTAPIKEKIKRKKEKIPQ